MTFRLWYCKRLDKSITNSKDRADRYEVILKRELEKLSTVEFIKYGIDCGYDEKE